MKVVIKTVANGYILETYETHETKEYKSNSIIFKNDLDDSIELLGYISDHLRIDVLIEEEQRD